jgi:hypothetical protein
MTAHCCISLDITIQKFNFLVDPELSGGSYCVSLSFAVVINFDGNICGCVQDYNTVLRSAILAISKEPQQNATRHYNNKL